MAKYVLQRLFAMLLTLICIISLTFVIMHSIPGGPFTREKQLPEAVLKALNQKYHLDDPLFKQFADYLTGLLSGDMGPSFVHANREVSDMIGSTFPITLKIGFPAIIVTVMLGVPLGVLAALRQGKFADSFIMFLTTLGVTIPSFVLAALLIYFFAVKLGWFAVVSSSITDIRAIVLPVMAISGYSLSFITRLMRSSMLDVIRQDYIRTARAKGISEAKVILKHALKNAIIPIITYLGPMTAALLTGSFVIEKMFTIPGIGQLFVSSMTNRDYTVILGTTIFYAVLLVIMNFIVDIVYGLIDPRIKIYSGKES